MRQEISAGGVVYKVKDSRIYFLLIKDMNGNWTFPKGLIEKGEDIIETAKREIQEEVGLKDLKLCIKLDKIGYWYRFKGELIKKTVYYFLFQTLKYNHLKPQHGEGISELGWFTTSDVIKKIGYKRSNLPIIKKAISYFKINNE